MFKPHFFRSARLSFSLLMSVAASSTALAAETYLNPMQEPGMQQHVQLLQAQQAANQRQAQGLAGKRIWFAGFGLHSGSNAFRGDVLLMQKRLRELYPDLISYTFDNQKQSQQLQAPFANFASIDQTVTDISAQLRDDDVVVVMLSDHGHKNMISVEIADQKFGPVFSNHLQTALAPLKKYKTVVLISACHSGSFIEHLKNPKRIILTAAAAENVSYGCQPLANNTFFIDAMFAEALDPDHSLQVLFDATKVRISRREFDEKLKSSEPQIHVGEDMREFAQRSWRNWLK